MSKLFVLALKVYLLFVLMAMLSVFCIWIARPNRKISTLFWMLADCFQYPFWIFTSKGRAQIVKSTNQR